MIKHSNTRRHQDDKVHQQNSVPSAIPAQKAPCKSASSSSYGKSGCEESIKIILIYDLAVLMLKSIIQCFQKYVEDADAKTELKHA